MSGQVAQLDPGSCRVGSPPFKIGAQALGGLKGPLMCEKKKKKKQAKNHWSEFLCGKKTIVNSQ